MKHNETNEKSRPYDLLSKERNFIKTFKLVKLEEILHPYNKLSSLMEIKFSLLESERRS